MLNVKINESTSLTQEVGVTQESLRGKAPCVGWLYRISDHFNEGEAYYHKPSPTSRDTRRQAAVGKHQITVTSDIIIEGFRDNHCLITYNSCYDTGPASLLPI